MTIIFLQAKVTNFEHFHNIAHLQYLGKVVLFACEKEWKHAVPLTTAFCERLMQVCLAHCT
jgi:hypothetical protein